MGYRIGLIAGWLDMSVEGLRFYERRGLVAPARTASGYRAYGEAELGRLRFIKAAQEMGFSLAEIEDLLEIRDGPAESCTAMRDRLAAKLETVHRRIELLRGFASDLEEGVKRCEARLRRGETDECPVLDELGASVSAGPLKPEEHR